MTLKTEFEKAMFMNPEYAKKHTPEQMALALWAARWMAEELASNIEPDDAVESLPTWIRTVAKELK